MVQVAKALARAHRRGLVHRDLKPKNLLLTVDGDIKVLDFGLVKMLAPSDGGGDTLDPLTHPGSFPGGTPGYMAPEQVLGGTVTPATDVFALGIIIHFSFSGIHPFKGDTSAAIQNAILKDSPTLLDEQGLGLPAGLATLVARCLEREPTRRFADASEVERALAQLPALPGIFGEQETVTVVPDAVLAGLEVGLDREDGAFEARRSGAPEELGARSDRQDRPPRSGTYVEQEPDERSREWRDLAEKFRSIPATVDAEWTDPEIPGAKPWEVRGQRPQDVAVCEGLCLYAGALILKSPRVLASVSARVASIQDPGKRWLAFLSERSGKVGRQHGFVINGANDSSYHTLIIENVGPASTGASLACAALELEDAKPSGSSAVPQLAKPNLEPFYEEEDESCVHRGPDDSPDRYRIGLRNLGGVAARRVSAVIQSCNLPAARSVPGRRFRFEHSGAFEQDVPVSKQVVAYVDLIQLGSEPGNIILCEPPLLLPSGDFSVDLEILVSSGDLSWKLLLTIAGAAGRKELSITVQSRRSARAWAAKGLGGTSPNDEARARLDASDREKARAERIDGLGVSLQAAVATTLKALLAEAKDSRLLHPSSSVEVRNEPGPVFALSSSELYRRRSRVQSISYGLWSSGQEVNLSGWVQVEVPGEAAIPLLLRHSQTGGPIETLASLAANAAGDEAEIGAEAATRLWASLMNELVERVEAKRKAERR